MRERCPQCGADLPVTNQVKCEYCGWIDWETLKWRFIGYMGVVGIDYLLRKTAPTLEKEQPWTRRVLSWLASRWS